MSFTPGSYPTHSVDSYGKKTGVSCPRPAVEGRVGVGVPPTLEVGQVVVRVELVEVERVGRVGSVDMVPLRGAL